MAALRFTPEIRAVVLEAFAAGCSVSDAAKHAELNPTTLKKWLSRGRKAESGAYAEFARAVDDARQAAADREEPMTEEELRLEVSRSAKKGNVQAQKLYWEMIRADSDEEPEEPADPLAALDELAERRAVGAVRA